MSAKKPPAADRFAAVEKKAQTVETKSRERGYVPPKEEPAQPAPTNTRTRRRRTSPYTIQSNIRLRVGMPELLDECAYLLGHRALQETIEAAIGDMVKKRKELVPLRDEYDRIVNEE